MNFKELLKPGMLVKLRDYEELLIVYIDDMTISDKLSLSWNDNSGRTLQLVNYNNDLTYKDNLKEYDIIIIYSLGTFYEPYSMSTEHRYTIWRRDTKNVFSLNEKIKAGEIKRFFNYLCDKEDEITIERVNPELLNIKSESISMMIPNIVFHNLYANKFSLDAIINDQILQ